MTSFHTPPWHAHLLRFLLEVCGCCNEPSAENRSFKSPPRPVTIYFQCESALVRRQMQFRRARIEARSYFSAVTQAFSVLAIAEMSERIAGARRLLPSWYKTRPVLHEKARSQASRASNATQPVIEAVVMPRPARSVGRTRALLAREPCPAQFVLRKRRLARACTPLRERQ